MEVLKYAVRLAAAVVMIGVAVVLAILATATDAAGTVLAVAGVLGVAAFFSWPRRPNAWRRDPPTQRQLQYAADLGIRIPSRATKGQVSDLISEVKGR